MQNLLIAFVGGRSLKQLPFKSLLSKLFLREAPFRTFATAEFKLPEYEKALQYLNSEKHLNKAVPLLERSLEIYSNIAILETHHFRETFETFTHVTTLLNMHEPLVRFTHSFIASPLSDRIQPELFPAFQRASYSAGLLGDRANVKSITAFLETASENQLSAAVASLYGMLGLWNAGVDVSPNDLGTDMTLMTTSSLETPMDAQFALLKTALQENIETVSVQDLLSSYQMIAQAFSGCVRDQNFSIAWPWPVYGLLDAKRGIARMNIQGDSFSTAEQTLHECVKV